MATAVRSRSSIGAAERRFRPVVFFGVLGGLFLVLLAYEWSAWVLDGGAHRISAGSSEVPGWLQTSLLIYQVAFFSAGLVVGYIFLIRPWRRTRQLTPDGMLFIAWLTAWAIQDPWINYTRPWFSYTSKMVNLGCPQCYAPGWQSSRAIAEPIFFILGAYMFGMFGLTVAGCAVLRKVKERYPRVGPSGLVAAAIGFAALASVIGEPIMMASGTYQYPGAIRSVSVFAGTRYQYPVYETVLFGLWIGTMICARYFKNDKGQTLMERGIETVKGTSRRKQLLKLASTIGLVNAVMLLTFNVPLNYWGLHSDNWPSEVVNTTYLNSTICGLGTDQACPGPRIPMPVGPDSGHATPEGRFIAPKGLPNQLDRQ